MTPEPRPARWYAIAPPLTPPLTALRSMQQIRSSCSPWQRVIRERHISIRANGPAPATRCTLMLSLHPLPGRLRETCRPQRLDHVGDGLGQQSQLIRCGLGGHRQDAGAVQDPPDRCELLRREGPALLEPLGHIPNEGPLPYLQPVVDQQQRPDFIRYHHARPHAEQRRTVCQCSST